MEKEQSKRAKGGRPLKKIKRERNVRVRLTVSEHLRIEHKAKLAKMTISEWVRASAVTAKVSARLSPDELGHFRVLSGLANNLNQLTKLAHVQGLLIVQRKCRELLGSIDQLLTKLGGNDW
ncbi:MAG: plasmid mobilization relaxosome protein MobC [Pedobacter sp.]|jgi:hypothetical protein|uniref:plasmid mobilization protein n=1 Tax=Pedobacter sp. TaxID=1411316 RepID=UPI0035675EE4